MTLLTVTFDCCGAGVRQNITNSDLSTILPEEVEEEVREAAEISMGTEVSDQASTARGHVILPL